MGTPGCVLGLAREKTLKLDKIYHFVLDEFDQVLKSLDIQRDIQDFVWMAPHKKQVMMFSATLSE